MILSSLLWPAFLSSKARSAIGNTAMIWLLTICIWSLSIQILWMVLLPTSRTWTMSVVTLIALMILFFWMMSNLLRMHPIMLMCAWIWTVFTNTSIHPSIHSLLVRWNLNLITFQRRLVMISCSCWICSPMIVLKSMRRNWVDGWQILRWWSGWLGTWLTSVFPLNWCTIPPISLSFIPSTTRPLMNWSTRSRWWCVVLWFLLRHWILRLLRMRERIWRILVLGWVCWPMVRTNRFPSMIWTWRAFCCMLINQASCWVCCLLSVKS